MYKSGDRIWWLRKAQNGIQRIPGVVFYTCNKTVKIKVSVQGSTHVRGVNLDSLAPRDGDDGVADSLKSLWSVKESGREKRGKYNKEIII